MVLERTEPRHTPGSSGSGCSGKKIRHGNIFHKWNESVGAHLGNRGGRGLATIHVGGSEDILAS